MKLDKCLCCDGELAPLIDFGLMPLVNTYAVTEKYPLAVNRCKVCCHLQLSENVDPEILYRDYAYCSGTGRTALEYFTRFAREAVAHYPKARNVLDIACNDGSQLDAFQKLGLETFGVDPAENLQTFSVAKGHCVCCDFFENVKLTNKFDIVTAQNVIAHTAKPLEFLKNCAEVMHDESKLFIATSQANLIVNGECDTIYHEHVSYFNAHSMTELAERAGLKILDIIMHDIHGTSYVFVLGKVGKPAKGVGDRMEWERIVGLLDPTIYNWWEWHAINKMDRIRKTITDFSAQGYYTVGCGAAAKGISMLNMAKVKLDMLADNTPTKFNKVTSGMTIYPFQEIENIKAEKVLFVLLAWNLAQEIRTNVLKLRDKPDDVFIETR